MAPYTNTAASSSETAACAFLSVPGVHSEQVLFTFAGSGQLCAGLQQRYALHEL